MEENNDGKIQESFVILREKPPLYRSNIFSDSTSFIHFQIM